MQDGEQYSDAPCAMDGRPCNDGHTHTLDEWREHRLRQRRKEQAPGDMHEPPPYRRDSLEWDGAERSETNLGTWGKKKA